MCPRLTSFYLYDINDIMFWNWCHMASLNVRNLSERTHKALRIRAARHGRSMEAEIRAILDDAVNPRERLGLGSMLTAIARDFGGVDLDIKRDRTQAEPANFE